MQIIDDRFELDAEVHTGGMSTVYRALDRTKAGHPVAVKLPKGQSQSQAVRFKAEAELLKGLNHPSIVSYVAHGEVDDSLYLAMEWLEGESLFERLHRSRLTMQESLSLVRKAAEGLAIVHGQGVAHRDIKPGNLFLRDKAPDKVKLLDFGIAMREGKGLTTHVDFNGGTWAYMSPEQAMGAAELGSRTDIFSLGCVLFECITGRRAYIGDRATAMVAKIWKDPPRVRDLCADVPLALDAMVAKMMARDPNARPHNGALAAAALSSVGRVPDRLATLNG